MLELSQVLALALAIFVVMFIAIVVGKARHFTPDFFEYKEGDICSVKRD